MTDVLHEVTKTAYDEGKQSILIGGHAVAASGFVRTTGDIDFLVKKSDRDFWIQNLTKHGYLQKQLHDVFARFEIPSCIGLPLNLMFVADEIFNQIWSESTEYQLGSIKTRLPSKKHLIALKLHALKQRLPHREEKDLNDVKELKLLAEINDNEFRTMCQKYDRLDIYEKLKKDI